LSKERAYESKREHALVLGGSLAGLLAARVLSDHFERVTLVERDLFPLAPESRRGTPQANHVHALMPRGRQIVEQLFPHLHEEMMADGAPLIDIGHDISWLTPQGWGVRFKSGLEVLAFTRPLLDFHVRRRLSTIANIRVLQDTEIVRLAEGQNNKVGGALLRARTTDGASVETILKADLVVDATGRASRAPDWLAELGYPKPTETVVNAYLGYASRLYEPPAELSRDWQCVFVQSAPPDEKRGGLLFAVEGNRWLLTLIGGGHDYPPRDEEGFLEFARSLRSPILYDAIKKARPLSPIKTHRGTENRLRHFWALSNQPSNFVALGDALCAFNPVYGQGMTIAAMGVLELDSCLRDKKIESHNFSKIFHRRLANVTKAPWLLATGQDYRYLETVGGAITRTTRFMHAYMDRILTLSTVDKTVRTVLLKVFGMLALPSALFRPRILRRVVWQSLRGVSATEQQQAKTPRRRLAYETSLERRLSAK
jgi:2-polyprenyl-6-methoxyphenol hydroxylase-like FAD-dependent oxidoreductase